MDRVGISIAIPALDELGIVQYAFTTRQNGLGERTQGFKQAEDWRPVADSFGIAPDRVVTVNQVHGVGILRIDGANYRSARSLDADAMITRERGIAIGVETADCVPVLLIDPVSPAAAAVHAGWRSTVQRIVQKTVARMVEEFASDASRILAAIGPAIGPECYEVDGPVMGPVRTTFPYWKEVASPRGQEKWSLDLGRLNRRQLLEAGLSPVNIYSLGLCTSCNPDLFYSFRREGRTGRMLSVVMIKP